MHPLYKNIKDLREERDISQSKLAELTGYTNRSSITKIEKGEVDLSLSKIEQFAKVFGKEPGELVGWEYEEQTTDPTPKIMQYYSQLNDIGKHEAEKRVEELTHLQKYTKEGESGNNTEEFSEELIPTKDYLMPNAAHDRTDVKVTEDMKKSDDAFFDED